MSSVIKRPVPISASHDVSGFSCGEPELDDYLRMFALSNNGGGYSKTFVVTSDGVRVIGFFSICASSVRAEEVPERFAKGFGKLPIPVVLLARLAVDREWRGQGIGSSMVRFAIRNAVTASDFIGIRAFMVHAKNEKVCGFYSRLDFVNCPGDSLRMAVLMKDARSTLRQHPFP